VKFIKPTAREVPNCRIKS